MADRIFYTIEEDGTITQRADGKISDVNHGSADQLMRDIEKTAGGEVTRSSSKGKHDVHELRRSHAFFVHTYRSVHEKA